MNTGCVSTCLCPQSLPSRVSFQCTGVRPPRSHALLMTSLLAISVGGTAFLPSPSNSLLVGHGNTTAFCTLTWDPATALSLCITSNGALVGALGLSTNDIMCCHLQMETVLLLSNLTAFYFLFWTDCSGPNFHHCVEQSAEMGALSDSWPQRNSFQLFTTENVSAGLVTVDLSVWRCSQSLPSIPSLVRVFITDGC